MTQQEQRTNTPVAVAAGAAPGRAPGSAGMGRIAMASAVGTMCEFYDFNIYGTAAALVFPHIFFPALGTAAGTAASFATLGVAFVARPFGSILFGHFGDRLGRKKTLIATLLTMGIATLLVGLMPTATQIGVAAPILVVALRILQGLAAGGEYAGGVLFGSENAPKAQRGLWAMFPNLGGGGAIVLANITFLLTALFMPTAQFTSWGWRIPFLASVILVAIGLWIRLRIDETPVFKQEVARAGVSRVPFIEAFRSQPRRILLATGTAIGAVYVLTYIGGAYMTSYGTETLKLARTYVLTVAIAGGVAISIGVVAGALLSDRFGRRPVITVAVATAAVWSLVLFPILDTKSSAAFALGVPFTMLIAGFATGPVPSFLSELFPTRFRYTAAGFSYGAAGIIGGAIPPYIASTVIPAAGGFAFGLILAALCLISLGCVLSLRETRDYELEQLTVAKANA
jgi:MFS family permease